MRVLARFSVLACLIGRVSETNGSWEFNFALPCLLSDLLPDGEGHLGVGGCLWEQFVPHGVEMPGQARGV